MEALIQQSLDPRIDVGFHGPLEKFIQLGTLVFGEPAPQRFKLPAVFLTDVTLTANQGWNEHRKDRTRFSTLMCEIRFD